MGAPAADYASSRIGITNSGPRSRSKIPKPPSLPNAAAASGVTVTNALAGGSEFDKNNNSSLNHVPDMIGKIAWEPEIDGAQPLHIEAFGLYRDFYDRVNIAAVNGAGAVPAIGNVNVSGGGFGGSVTWTAIPKILDLQATAMTGTGIGRYGSGQLPDMTFLPNGAPKPLQETTMLFGATLHATPLLDIYTYLGQEGESAKYFNVGSQQRYSWAWAIPATNWRLLHRRRFLFAQYPGRKPGQCRRLVEGLSGQVRQLPPWPAIFLHPSRRVPGAGATAGSMRPNRRQHGLHQHSLLSVLDFAYV